MGFIGATAESFGETFVNVGSNKISDAITHDDRLSIASAVECCLAAQAKADGHSTFRSGVAIHEQRVAIVPR